jgi:hypothetical protein
VVILVRGVLASAVPPLNVGPDVGHSVLAHTICPALRRHLPGYHPPPHATLQRRFLSTSGIITSRPGQITGWLDRRTYSPMLRQSSLPKRSPCPSGTATPSAANTPDSTGGRFAY